MKGIHYLQKEGGSNPQAQLVWVERGVGQMNRKGLQLTHPLRRCCRIKKDCLEGKQPERTAVKGLKCRTHEECEDQFQISLGHNRRRGGNTCWNPLRKRITTGDLNNDWSGIHKKAERDNYRFNSAQSKGENKDVVPCWARDNTNNRTSVYHGVGQSAQRRIRPQTYVKGRRVQIWLRDTWMPR